MIEDAFRRDHHFVSRVYLRRWASSHSQKTWVYRTLVSAERVPKWVEKFIRGVAYHSHLYTSLIAGQESDQMERWLAEEFEAPAAEALEQVTNEGRLRPDDWERLVRFLAAQDVRTPTRLIEYLERGRTEIPQMIEESMRESVRELGSALEAGKPLPKRPEGPSTEGFPLRVTKQLEPGAEEGTLKGAVVVGRGMWLYHMRLLLTRTIRVLHGHRWTVLRAPPEMSWFTTDNPVVRLNFTTADQYDFKGGWGSPGTDIFMPLSPRHLLFTQVGTRPPDRGTVLSRDKAGLIRRFLAESADRLIFAHVPDPEVERLRPRVISAEMVKSEKEQWEQWHEDQCRAERRLME